NQGGGVASQMMRETLRLAREREAVVSALMPFRASFYEHFGYGIVERRCTWTVPLANFPAGDVEGMRFFEANDLPALAACHQRCAANGQCEVERSPAAWDVFLRKVEDGLLVMDCAADGMIRGYLAFQTLQQNGKDTIYVSENVYEDMAALRRQLYFLASQRDQYSVASITLPADVPLNWLLREVQIPHRLVNHPTPEVRPFTLMQLRVLDHARLIEAMHLPAGRAGKVVVGVRESEGRETRFAIDFHEGKASVSRSAAAAEFECADHIWAAVVCGNLPATQALKLGLASASGCQAARQLDVFAEGPLPFNREYW
ncbi:MAG TPA: GNAT family N-acetyltransferase, partial [Tepidisphaeraceae bacterium]|nr:GNAT family N-acetyltransferase [Tepidisphaeraceae bacterium]